MRQGTGIPAMLAACALALGCEYFPKDPRGTLDDVRGDTLEVGVTEARPWVVRVGDEPAGVEVELVRAFADSLGATVRWHWGAAEEHFAALERFRLHLAIGGLTRASPWARRLGVTEPFHTSRITVGVPPGTVPPADDRALRDQPVAVRAGTATVALLEDEDARPVLVDSVDSVRDMWIAAPDHDIMAMGWDTSGVTLRRDRHVLAAPPGENAFLMALENAVRRADVARLLARARVPR